MADRRWLKTLEQRSKVGCLSTSVGSGAKNGPILQSSTAVPYRLKGTPVKYLYGFTYAFNKPNIIIININEPFRYIRIFLKDLPDIIIFSFGFKAI